MKLRVTQLMCIGAMIALLATGCGNADSSSRTAAATSAVPNPASTGTVNYPAPASYDTAPKTPLRKGEHFQTLSMAGAYTPDPPAHGTDDYRCFIVDPKLTRTAFLTGSQFRPDNAAIVHHAIFFQLARKDVAAARKLDAAAPGQGYTCFSGTGIGSPAQQLGGAPWIAAWAPGVGETLAARGTGYEMHSGDEIIMQVHYNLLATGGKATGADRSGIRLRWAPRSAELQPLHTTLLVAPVELPCPAGETGRLCDRDLSIFDEIRRFGQAAGTTIAGLSLLCEDGQVHPGNTQHCDRTARQTMYVQQAAGHMHLLGRSISVTLNPKSRAKKTLLNVPVYDFDDQGARTLAKPVTVRPGDDLRVQCTWDATLRSQLPQLKTLPPRYVMWGEGTSDEMCLGILVWTAKPASA